MKSSKEWLDRAEEMRVLAALMCSEVCRDHLLNDAVVCEKAAKLAGENDGVTPK